MDTYRDLGLLVRAADNSRESGIYQVWERLSTGRLKVFKTMQNWLAEYRIYRRDEHGRIIKENDHIMDATRYLVMSGIAVSCTKPRDDEYFDDWGDDGRSDVGGY